MKAAQDKAAQDYVLVLDQQPNNLQTIETLLKVLQCPAVITDSTEQVVARVNQDFPYLMILVGNHQSWPITLVNELRNLADTFGGTILSLSDASSQSWPRQEDNPGFDGFLVKPLNRDVLMSLVQSAWVKQFCRVQHCSERRSHLNPLL